MSKLKALFLILLICAGVVGFASTLLWRRHACPDPTATTNIRLGSVASASVKFQLTYGSWPTGFAQFYPDNNHLHIAFLHRSSWATNDAWGHALLYRPFDSTVGYGSVVSVGRDGRRDLEERFQ